AALLAGNDRKVLASGEPLLVQERVLLGGQPVTYRSSKFPLYDESGRVYAVCGVSTDITDVVEADRRKDEFIATLAHELRNPLAPVPLHGDLTRLAQVFSNLVSNAVRYTPPGGQIAVRARLEGGQAVVEVADSGNGIAPDVLPDIFGLFAQGHGPHHGNESGL